MIKQVCLFVVFILLSAFFAVCFAADVVGSAGTPIVESLARLLGDNTTAISVYTLILGILGIVVRVFLKRLPTGTQTIVGKIVWSILSGLFGDGVVLSNQKDPEALKEQLKKKYPLLNIEIKK